MIKRFFTPPKKQSFFLFGPRGTGKTRFLKNWRKDAVFIDLLDDATFMRFSSNPAHLEPIVQSLQAGQTLVVDEVQKCPPLLSKVHQIMEDDDFPSIQFVLTGSSSRKLKRYGVDLLAGRAIVTTMHPFLGVELGERFDLERSLKLGLIPVVTQSETPELTLSSYIAVYLREEVKQEGLVKNLEAFTRFLEAMSFSHGEILNLSNVARECSVKRSTVDGYLGVLEDLLLGYRLPPFKKLNRKSIVDSDKFYFFDVGVYRSLRPVGPLDPPGNVLGAALEGLVLQNLKAWVAYFIPEARIFFWRTEAGTEVDFVIYGPKIFLAIEVKNTSHVQKSDLSGLKSFGEDYPKVKCFFLFRGKVPEKHGSINCVPVESFLKKIGDYLESVRC